MPELKKLLELDQLEYFETHLSLVNCLLPTKMTPKEIEVLARFMSLEGDVAKYRFGPTGRKLVMETMKLTSPGLSNYIKALTEKELLRKEGDVITILPILFPESNLQDYRFRLIKRVKPITNGTVQ